MKRRLKNIKRLKMGDFGFFWRTSQKRTYNSLNRCYEPNSFVLIMWKTTIFLGIKLSLDKCFKSHTQNFSFPYLIRTEKYRGADNFILKIIQLDLKYCSFFCTTITQLQNTLSASEKCFKKEI